MAPRPAANEGTPSVSLGVLEQLPAIDLILTGRLQDELVQIGQGRIVEERQGLLGAVRDGPAFFILDVLPTDKQVPGRGGLEYIQNLFAGQLGRTDLAKVWL